MRMIKTVIMLLGISGWALTSNAAQDLPFADHFTNSVGSSVAAPWTSTSTIYTNSPTPKDGSSTCVYSDESLSLAVNDSLASNVWCHYYTKVTTHSEPPSMGNAVAAFYVNSDGDLMASSNNVFIVVATGVATNDWIGFSVHLDYLNNCWDLYRTTNAYTYGDSLVKQNTTPMLFNSADSGKLTNVTITGVVNLDSFSLTEGRAPIVPGAASPTYTSGSSSGTALTLDETYTGALLSYLGGSGTLNGAFGDALGSLLLATDRVNIFVPQANPAWQIFTYQGPGQPWAHSGDSTYSNLTVTPTTGLYIEHVATGTRTPAFSAAFDSITSHTAAGPTTIYGTNVTARGWNILSLPFTAGPRSIINGVSTLGLDAIASEGDRIYLRKNDRWEQEITYRSGKWVRGRTPVNVTFPSGSAFWYRRNATATAQWDSDTL